MNTEKCFKQFQNNNTENHKQLRAKKIEKKCL